MVKIIHMDTGLKPVNNDDTYEGVTKSFRTEAITKSTTTINTTQSIMAANVTILTHKIAIKLHLLAENCTILATGGQFGNFWVCLRTFKYLCRFLPYRSLHPEEGGRRTSETLVSYNTTGCLNPEDFDLKHGRRESLKTRTHTFSVKVHIFRSCKTSQVKKN
jgi:hypothetical protein